MKISVVTVTFNCEKIIEDTILSVINQDFDNLEYIIIDGASSDRTLDIINKYSNDIDKIVSEPDKGIFDAMNKSLEFVTGDYVLFMNAGDRFVNNQVIINIFEKEHTEDLIYGDTYNQTVWGYFLRGCDDIYSHNPSKRDLVFKSQGFCHQSLFTKTSVLKQIKFDLKFPLGADYDTTYRVYCTGNHKIVNVGFPVAIFDDRNGGASHNVIKKIYSERFVFFDYVPSFLDKLLIYKMMVVSNIKHFFKIHFPTLFKFLMKDKYIQTL